MAEEENIPEGNSMSAKVLVFGLNYDNVSTTLFYDAVNDSWSLTMAKENDSCNFNYDMLAVCKERGHKVYFTEHVDAYTDESNLKVFVYDTVAGQIHQQANLPDPPVLGSGALLDQHFYMAGGQNQALSPITAVQRYDVEAGTWTTVSEILEPHICPGMTALNGQLYIVGSMVFELEEADGSCQRYDPTANEWTMVAKVPSHLSRTLVVTAHEGKLHAVQVNSLKELYVYSMETNEWEIIEISGTVPSVESVHIVSSGGHLVVIDEHCCVFKYNADEKCWNKGSDNPGIIKKVCNAVATHTE